MSSHSNPIRPSEMEALDACEDESEVVMGDTEDIATREERSDGAAGSADGSEAVGGAPMFDESVEADKPAIMKAPYRPGAKEVADHNLTHCPPRTWCDHCVKGQSKNYPHLRITGDYADSTVTRVNMDYCYLKQDVSTTSSEHEESSKARSSMTVLIMQETECASVWAYAVETKGAGAENLVEQITDDFETIGLTKEKLILKADQEASITDVQRAIVKRRVGHGTGLEQGKVGDSNTNGRVEKAIQDFKGLSRTHRSALEENIGCKISLEDNIVPWLVRHMGHLITICRVRGNGRTAYQKMKGRRTNAQLVPFGETVLFKVPKTQHVIGDFEDRWEQGVWVGFVMRSGEHLVSTAKGTFKVGTVMRRAPGKQWSSELVKAVSGTPQNPIPGSASHNIPTFAKKFEDANPDKSVFMPAPIVEQQVRAAYIYAKDVQEHGATDGCPGCRAVTRSARYRATHSAACRQRFEQIFAGTDEGKKRVELARDRMTQAIVDKSEQITAEQNPEASRAKRAREQPAAASGSTGSGGGENVTTEIALVPKEVSTEMALVPEEVQSRKRSADGPHEDNTWSKHTTVEATGADGEEVMPEGTLPSIRAALYGKDASIPQPIADSSMEKQDQGMSDAPTTSAIVGTADEAMEEQAGVDNMEQGATSAKRTKSGPLISGMDRWRKRIQSRIGGIPDDAGYTKSRHLGTDESARPELTEQQAPREWPKTKPPVKDAEEVFTVGHPSPETQNHDINKCEKVWKNIGSGVMARTFKGAQRLMTTTKD